MSVKDRIKKYIKSQEISVSSFEKSINVSNGYINSISKGIGAEKSLLISRKYPNLNMSWLLRGEGDMLKSENNHAKSLSKSDDFYEILKNYKEKNSLTYNKLGEIISVNADTFRMAMTNRTFSEMRKEKLLSVIKNKDYLNLDNKSNSLTEKEVLFVIEALYNNKEQMESYSVFNNWIEKIKQQK